MTLRFLRLDRKILPLAEENNWNYDYKTKSRFRFLFCPLWAKGRPHLFRPSQPEDEVWCGGDRTTAHHRVTMKMYWDQMEDTVSRRLENSYSLLQPCSLVWPFSTEIFSNETWLWSLDSQHLSVHFDTMSIRQKMRPQEREPLIWVQMNHLRWAWVTTPPFSADQWLSQDTVRISALVFYKLPWTAQKTYSDEKSLGIKDGVFCCRNL